MKEIKIATANINRYKKAIAWIEKNTIKNSGITVTSKQKVIYPEVTGYYIPTLIRWGKKELANKYADYLISIQKEDGSWYDSQNHVPYIFDSGQILKGLIAIYPYQSTVKENIIRGCEWILSRENKFGRLVTPSKDAWGCDKHFCDEYVHLYCLEPILKAGKLFGRQDFIEAVNRIKKYYINEYKDRILHFDMLSHFHAYVMEALVDLGEIELARTAMHNIERYQKKNGSIPGLNSVNWICSTGLFQLAIVWFKLGNVSCGNNAFEYACKLQNSSGGWYGSYSDFKFASVLTKIKGVRRIIHKHVPIYFPNEEISWAVKYFLDALYFKSKSNFDTNDDNWKQMSIDKIPESDERYKIIEDAVSELPQGGGIILDAGCGQGRYLNNLVEKYKDKEYYGMDLSSKALKSIKKKKPSVNVFEGSLTNIEKNDNFFDIVYCCEALEHAVDIEAAVCEMIRITKINGKIIIIDKPIYKLGVMPIGNWECWIDEKMIKNVAKKNKCDISIKKNVQYEGEWTDDLFHAWILTKNK